MISPPFGCNNWPQISDCPENSPGWQEIGNVTYTPSNDWSTVTITSPKAGKILETHGSIGTVVQVHSVLVVFDLDGATGGASAEAPTNGVAHAKDEGPAATAVRPTGLNVTKEKWVQALTLTAVAALESPPTLLVPSGWFKPKRPEHLEPAFIGGFTQASQDHEHYEEGRRLGDIIASEE